VWAAKSFCWFFPKLAPSVRPRSGTPAAQVAAHDWAALATGLTVTLSVGLTSAPPYDAETLSLRADSALYRAKAAGRNRVVQG
jgi:GGDEF domain-containing protein